jgi:Spy/CpxP family protein refolding chaperone
MMTAKATVALVLAYVLALAAGTTSGVLAERMHQVPISSAPLAEQLNLTQAQCDQMRAVWQTASDTADDCFSKAESLEDQRDDALIGLLTDQQKNKFAEMDKAFAAQYAVLGERRQAAFREAFLKTEQMLTPAQRVRYEAIVRERLGKTPTQPGDSNPPPTNIMRP